MRYPATFIACLIMCSISGIFISLLNNDLAIGSIYDNLDQKNNHLRKKYDDNKENPDLIKEKEEELKNQDEEKKKKIQEEQKKKKEKKERKKEKEKKKKEEEQKKREEEIERQKKEEELKKKENEEKRRKEEEKRKKKEEEERRKKKEEERKKKEEEERKKKVEAELKNKIFEENKIISNNTKAKEGKLRIACAYALDDSYVYPTLVAMTSLAENAGEKTFYDIYVMIGSSFKDENKKVIKSVETKHPEHCEVIFIDMGNKFQGVDTNRKITTPTYYRLELHNILPNVNRIIWMDGDTAVFEDLTELITLDMKGAYIMGFLDSIPTAIERFGLKEATVLCAGVLLLDLDALRKNNMTEKFNKFIIENLGNLNQHDQTVINVVCQGKTAPLPPKYGIWSFEAEIYALKHNNRQWPWLKYDENEFKKAYRHPAILHYVWPKPFWRKQSPIFNNEWWDYARKSGYYDEVFHKSPRWISNRLLLEKIYERNFYPYFY